jgi:hypothetical protein
MNETSFCVLMWMIWICFVIQGTTTTYYGNDHINMIQITSTYDSYMGIIVHYDHIMESTIIWWAGGRYFCKFDSILWEATINDKNITLSNDGASYTLIKN